MLLTSAFASSSTDSLDLLPEDLTTTYQSIPISLPPILSSSSFSVGDVLPSSVTKSSYVRKPRGQAKVVERLGQGAERAYPSVSTVPASLLVSASRGYVYNAN